MAQWRPTLAQAALAISLGAWIIAGRWGWAIVTSVALAVTAATDIWLWHRSRTIPAED